MRKVFLFMNVSQDKPLPFGQQYPVCQPDAGRRFPVSRSARENRAHPEGHAKVQVWRGFAHIHNPLTLKLLESVSSNLN